MSETENCPPACCINEQITINEKALKDDERRQNVREDYAKVAVANSAGESAGIEGSCCGVSDDNALNTLISTRLGYSEDELSAVPVGADMGLGCGNPKAIAALQVGEFVLDLGSGGGFDCFLAAAEVGANGKVIGVDMTPDMISKARINAAKGQYDNVEFRLGEIEHLPIADNSINVIISNCVINLSPDKNQVFCDAFRVLKPGGRLAIADVVASAEIPDILRNDCDLFSGCMVGASLIDDLLNILDNAGFIDVGIAPKDESRDFIRDWAPGRGMEEYVIAATIEAVKPF